MITTAHFPMNSHMAIMITCLALSSCTVYRPHERTAAQLHEVDLEKKRTYVLEHGTGNIIRLNDVVLDSSGLHGTPTPLDARTERPMLRAIDRQGSGGRRVLLLPLVGIHADQFQGKRHRNDAVLTVTRPIDSLRTKHPRAFLSPDDIRSIRTEEKDVKASRARTVLGIVSAGVAIGGLVLIANSVNIDAY